MNTDCYIDKGYSHKICQDYAISGDGYAIVSDGCSSSEHTDIGARVLSMCARELILRFLKSSDGSHSVPDYVFAGDYIVGRAWSSVQNLGLPMSCLDATLIMAFVYDGDCHVYRYGDGYVMLYRGDDNVGVYGNGIECWNGYAMSPIDDEITTFANKVEYPRNAPNYLTYRLDFKRQRIYDEMVGNDIRGFDSQNLSEWDYYDVDRCEFYDYYKFTDVHKLIIGTDGIGSFIEKSNGIAEEFLDLKVIEQILAFKNTKGEFIQRRCRSMIKKMKKNNIDHYDDFAVAGINLEVVQ